MGLHICGVRCPIRGVLCPIRSHRKLPLRANGQSTIGQPTAHRAAGCMQSANQHHKNRLPRPAARRQVLLLHAISCPSKLTSVPQTQLPLVHTRRGASPLLHCECSLAATKRRSVQRRSGAAAAATPRPSVPRSPNLERRPMYSASSILRWAAPCPNLERSPLRTLHRQLLGAASSSHRAS